MSEVPVAEASPALSRTGTVRETMARLADVSGCLIAANVAAYQWNTETDVISWSANAEAILGCRPEEVATGRAFAARLGGENQPNRYDTVMNSDRTDEGAGVAFEIEYEFHPHGRATGQTVWIEDTGRWFRGDASHPMRASGLVRRIDARHIREEELTFTSACDPLTGLMNHTRLMEALDTAISAAREADKSCAFAIISLRNLGEASDACGYEIADEVILAMSRRLRHVMRAQDVIARYSESKFAIILNDCDEADLQVAAERFLNVARDKVVETSRGPVWAMLAIGGLVMPQFATGVRDAIARAGEALADAMHLSADGACFYHPSSRRVAERNHNARCATQIVACLGDDRFRLAWQPVMTSQSETVLQHEALLRLQDENGDIIEAHHLVPVAGRLGLVRLIDRAVLQMALSMLLAHPQAHIAINFSGVTINDPRWFAQLANIMSDHRDIMERLTIEIPDVVARNRGQSLSRFAEALRDLRCQLTIEQFGMSPAMFSHPLALGASAVKLDGDLCAGLSKNPDLQPYVSSLIGLAHAHGVRAIATRVETADDAALLRKLGCDGLQGHFFGGASLLVPWTAQRSESFGFRVAAGLDPEQTDDSHKAPPAHPGSRDTTVPVAQTILSGAVSTGGPANFVFTLPDPALPEQKTHAVVPTGVSPAHDTLLPQLPPSSAPLAGRLSPLPSFEPDLSGLRQAIEALGASFSSHPEHKGTGRPAA